jgi:hypothetical protein
MFRAILLEVAADAMLQRVAKFHSAWFRTNRKVYLPIGVCGHRQAFRGTRFIDDDR